MRTTLSTAIGMGLMTLVSYVLLALAIFEMSQPLPETIQEAHGQFDSTRNLGMSQIISTWIIVGVYILWTYRSNCVPKHKRALWAALLVFGNVFVIPTFWYFYLFKPARSGQSYDVAT